MSRFKPRRPMHAVGVAYKDVIVGQTTGANGSISATKGYGFTMAYTAEGKYTITLTDPAREIIHASAQLLTAVSPGTDGAFLTVELASTTSVVIYAWSSAAPPVAADVIGKFSFMLVTRESSGDPV